MARPREFKPEEALDKAMGLFWEVGYQEASLADLLIAMGLSKGSFYKAFTDKQSVYLASLQRYEATVVDQTSAYLTNPAEGRGRTRILSLFSKIAEAAEADGDRLGCFLCNALVDKAAQGGEVEVRLQAMVIKLENGFLAALTDEAIGQGNGSAAKLRETARGILSVYFGLRVLGRAGLAATMAQDCVRQAETLIDAMFTADGGPAPAAS